MTDFDKWIIEKRIKQSNRKWMCRMVSKSLWEILLGLFLGGFLFCVLFK